MIKRIKFYLSVLFLIVITILAMNKPSSDYVLYNLYHVKHIGIDNESWMGRKKFNFIVLDVWQVGNSQHFIGFMNELY